MNASERFETKHAKVFAAILKGKGIRKAQAVYNTREDTGDVMLRLNAKLGEAEGRYRLHKLFGCGSTFEVSVYQAYFRRCKEHCAWTVAGIDIEGLTAENLGEAKKLHVRLTVSLESCLYGLAGHENYRVSDKRWEGVIDKPDSSKPLYRVTFKDVASASTEATRFVKQKEAAKAKKKAKADA
ncbi:MAG: hypothetical protein ACW99U_19265 [Candidatus Thorarchaeota archaeon]|jgi:hypothetical protein